MQVDLSKSLAWLKARLLARRNVVVAGTVVAITSLSAAAIFMSGADVNQLTATAANAETQPQLASFPVVVPHMEWGFALDTLEVKETEIQSGESLSDILSDLNVGNDKMQTLITNAQEVFDLRKLRAGKPLIQLAKDSTRQVDYLVYEPSAYEYVVFELGNEMKVWRTERPVTKEVQTAAGYIESSLWNAMINNGYSFELASKMEDALQWSIDFHHLQVNDEFRLVYEQEYVDGEPMGVGMVLAAYYHTGDTTEFYSLYFDGDEEETGYYDREGKPMNSGFLKAPVKYSRISSRFNLNRFHPVLKRRRPHLGTDYAAPYGTPIMAVGNGVVTRAGRTGGNGNFVKIRHDDTYETQYLHMQGFAEGIRTGVQVKQGQVIGYVGSTGLATGPHVCFRFWKNGRQVNHLKLQFPPAKPLREDLMPEFNALKERYLALLDEVQPEYQEQLSETEESPVDDLEPLPNSERAGNP